MTPQQTVITEIKAESESEFFKEAIEQIGEVKRTPAGTLQKDCFIKVFKYTAQLAKLKTRAIKLESQKQRCLQFFNLDPQPYLQTLKQQI